MKKIIFIFLTLFIFISSSQALSKFSLHEKVPDMYIESVKDGKVHNGIPFIIKNEDGKIVYCLNHQEKINTTDYYNEYKYNDNLFNLTDEQIDKINLISYYGYQYENHTDIKWYGITQYLIWKTLNYDDIYFTDANGNKINAYQEEIKEIEDLVEKYYTLPSFKNNKVEFSINSTNEFYDYNGVLSNYEIYSSNLDVSIHKNFQKAYVTTNKEGNYKIYFTRKSPIDNNYILYFLEDSQSLIYPGKIKDINFEIDVKVTKGSVTINKLDSENKSREFGTLEGATYGIYNGNELITTAKTDSNGKIYLENLRWGINYTIKELTPSKGYKLDGKEYNISLIRNKKDGILNIYSEIIKGNLIINKYYTKNGINELEDKAIFEIYDINNNLIDVCETKSGKIEKKLEYGEYYIIQKSGKPGYKYVDKFYANINEDKDYVYDLYSEEDILIVDVPNTKKTDYNKFISIIFIFIGLIFIFKSQKKTTQ